MTVSDLGLAFVLLRDGAAPKGTELITRPLEGSDLRVGLDRNGFKHVLAPIKDEIRQDRTSAALVLGTRVLAINGVEQLHADLYCTDSRLGLVFERLAADVRDRIAAGHPATVALPKALNDWRDLFRGGGGPTTETVLGLVGELTVLSRLAETAGVAAALDSWWGPEGHTHDFYSATGQAIEVKTTRGLGGSRIHVSNISQLDPADLSSLHLAVIRTKADRTAPTLDDRIRTLLEAGFPAAGLLGKVERAGYVFEAPVAVDTRYAVVSDRWWHISEEFPGIRESRINARHLRGVMTVKYELSLDSAPGELSPSQADALLSDWER